LEIILVPGDVASEDACTMEHHLDPKTVEQFSKFVEFVNNAPVSPKWLTHFKEYCKTGKYKCEFRD
jgi:DtxR family Mn-dependent transcriptional regulator